MTTKVRLLLALTVLAILASGCKNKGAPCSISGKVTYNGNPVTGGTVGFYPVEGEGPSYTTAIGPDGTYSTTDLPVGEVAVTVETGSANKDKKMPVYGKGQGGGGVGDPQGEKQGAVSPQPKDFQGGGGAYVAIPLKYNLPTTSGLKVKLEKGKNTYDIPLGD